MVWQRAKQLWNGARWGVLLSTGVMLLSLLPTQQILAISSGDAQMIYGTSASQLPAMRTLTSSGWSAASSLPTTGSTIAHIITRSAPTRAELIAGVQTTNGTLTVYRYNGTTWTTEWSVSMGSSSYIPRFDIAYQQLNGKAMVVYATNSSGANLAYRIWDGSTWTSATTRTASNATTSVAEVRLEPRRATNEIAMAWVDNNPSLSAAYYDGATGTWKSEPSKALDTDVAYTGTFKTGSKMFDMAFEDLSGRLMIMWGNDNYTYPLYALRSAGPSGTWGTITSGTSGTTATNGFATQGMDIQLAAEPGTNYIAYANIADYTSSSCGGLGQCASAAIWNGSSWGYYNAYDNTASQLQTSLVRTSVKWVQSGGQSRAVVVYDDDSAPGVDWLYFNKNTLTWSAVQPDFTGAPSPPSANTGSGAAAAMWLYNNPFNPAELTYVTAADVGPYKLYTKRLTFDGTTLSWSNIESSVLESNLSYRGGWVASLAYFNYIPPAGALSLHIVNTSGDTISTPVVAFPATSSGTQCQTVNATLGTSAQKIRINNTTTTAGWTVSIAPSAGSTAQWSQGSQTYDMNDSNGSGCIDGGDADTKAGRLGVAPSGSTITPQSGCSASGITKGSDSHFAEGTTDVITLLSASSSAATNCYWDVTNIGLSQTIPAFQPSGSYSLPMTITVTAT